MSIVAAAPPPTTPPRATSATVETNEGLETGGPVDEKLLATSRRQEAAFSEATHSPCYQGHGDQDAGGETPEERLPEPSMTLTDRA